MRSALPSRLFGWLFVLLGRCRECGGRRNDHLHGLGCTLNRNDEWCHGYEHHHFGE